MASLLKMASCVLSESHVSKVMSTLPTPWVTRSALRRGTCRALGVGGCAVALPCGVSRFVAGCTLRTSSRSRRGSGADKRDKGTGKRDKGTDNGNKGTGKRDKGTDKRDKGTDNRNKGTDDDGNKGTDNRNTGADYSRKEHAHLESKPTR